MTARRAAAAFVVAGGFSAGIAQVLLVRELLLACYGNEVSLGLTLAAWLVCGAAGTVLASRRRACGEAALAHTVASAGWLTAGLLMAACIAIAGVRVYPTLAGVVPMKLGEVFAFSSGLERLFTVHLAIQPGEMLGPLHLVLISFGAVWLPALCTGALFAVGLRLFGQVTGGEPSSPGRCYALDAIGHLAGGVLLGWAAVMVANVFLVAAVSSAVLWLAVFLLGRAAGITHRRSLLAGPGAVLLCVAGSGALQSHSLAVRWHGHEVLDQASSPFGHTAVVRQGSEGVIFFENGVPSGVSPALPSVEELVQFALLQCRRPRRVLVIGGGATGGVREVLKHGPERVEYAELDPRMLELARQWVSGPDRAALADSRVTSLAVDGRLVVKQAAVGLRPRYDAILLSLPDPSTAMLNRYYTLEWYREAAAALEPWGVLAWEMSSSRHYFRPSLIRFNSSILSAAAAVFARRALMPGEDTLAVAVGGPEADLSGDAAEVLRRLEARGIEAPYFEAMAGDRLEPFNRRFIEAELAKAPTTPRNRDLHPIGYLYDQAVWVGLYHPGLEELYLRAAGLRLHDLRAPAAAFLAVFLLMGMRPAGRRGYVVVSVVATGAMGMLLELVLLLAFQAFYGYVYHQVGIIIGAFMVGLALGAMGASGWLRGAGAPRASWALVGSQLMMGLCALALSSLLANVGSLGEGSLAAGWTRHVAFPMLTALVGLTVGLQFPLATAAFGLGGRSATAPHRAAARLYAADLGGASLGAAFSGALLVPALGIHDTCLAAAVLCALVACLLALRAVVDR